MSEFKGTPGPWSHDYRKSRSGGYSHEVFDQDGELIATAAWYPVKLDDVTTTTNREANARLIAAAPDLLALAEMVITNVDGAALVERDHPQAALADTLRAAYAARSKALGQ
jgi:hypothetical protein